MAFDPHKFARRAHQFRSAFAHKLSGPLVQNPAPLAVPSTQVPTSHLARLPCGLWFDDVMAGGLVPGSLVLFAGSPGLGKSTLSAQIAKGLADRGSLVLYVTAEETTEDVARRMRERELVHDRVFLLRTLESSELLAELSLRAYTLCVVDSLQGIAGDASGLAALELAKELESAARGHGVAFLMLAHANAAGDVAGLTALEHVGDATLVLEEDGPTSRVLTVTKNRHGALASARCEMTGEGLVSQANI